MPRSRARRWRRSAATACCGRSRARCAAPGRLAIIPGGRGNDLARVLGIPSEPAAAARLAGGRERPIDLGDVDGTPFVGIACLGFDSDANRIANEARLIRGNLVYALRGAACAGRLEAGTLHRDASTAQRHEFTGFAWPSATRATTAAACCCSRRRARRRPARRADGRADVEAGFLRGLPKVFKGAHVARPTSPVAARRGGRGRRRPAVRRLRRRRSDRRHSRPPCACERRALRVDRAGADARARPPARAPARAAARRALGRGGGTSPPGRLLLRLQPRRARGAWARARRAAGGDLGDQRQDHHRGDDRRRAGARRAPAGPQPRRARTWPGVSRPRCSTPGADRGQLGLFEVDEAWLGEVARALAARVLLLLANLFRDQLDRYGELELLADRWAELVAERRRPARRFVLNADDPLVADLGRGRARRDLLRPRGPLAGAAASCSTPPTPSTAAAAAPHTPTTRLPRPPGPLPLPELRPRAPRAAGGGRHGSSCDGMAGSRVSTCARPPASSTLQLPLPGLYNVYNALAAAATALRAGRAARRPSARRWRTSPPPSGARRRSTLDGRRCRSC